jgi:hypothetical protein
MSQHAQNQSRNDPPEGAPFLDAIATACGGVALQSNVVLAHDLRGTREALGTLLSLLDRGASCWWGCRNGDHVAEQLVGKCCANAEAAYTLAVTGYYDQSLSLSRSNMESANLCALFVSDSSTFEEWRQADARLRSRKYGPAEVRKRLESGQNPVPVSKEQYVLMCEKATHPSPTLPSGMYNVSGRSFVAGYFQPVGLGMAVDQLLHPLIFVGFCAPDLLGIEGDIRQRIHEAADAVSVATKKCNGYWTTLFAERLNKNGNSA